MQDGGYVYGWNIVLPEVMESAPSLPAAVDRFLRGQPQLVHPESIWRLGQASGVIAPEGR